MGLFLILVGLAIMMDNWLWGAIIMVLGGLLETNKDKVDIGLGEIVHGLGLVIMIAFLHSCSSAMQNAGLGAG